MVVVNGKESILHKLSHHFSLLSIDVICRQWAKVATADLPNARRKEQAGKRAFQFAELPGGSRPIHSQLVNTANLSVPRKSSPRSALAAWAKCFARDTRLNRN